jgi:2-polyprenyl-3-methyl-5-hydroxy-6-metoxy-1,4-benzoquinol methylase
MADGKAVDLYHSHYTQTEAEVYQQIRQETYGEDWGQTSWITADEARQLFSRLNIFPGANLVDVACGTGGLCQWAADELGVTAIGVDISGEAVGAAKANANQKGLEGRVSYFVQDASLPLDFEGEAFDVIFCNDSINHLPNRLDVLREWQRLLKPGGQILYTDPVVITGPVTNQELAIRASIGFFLFLPPGENETLLQQAGFKQIHNLNLTQSVVTVSLRWLEARARRADSLIAYEGKEQFEGLQRFLAMVHTLASESRLSRIAFFARK